MYLFLFSVCVSGHEIWLKASFTTSFFFDLFENTRPAKESVFKRELSVIAWTHASCSYMQEQCCNSVTKPRLTFPSRDFSSDYIYFLFYRCSAKVVSLFYLHQNECKQMNQRPKFHWLELNRKHDDVRERRPSAAFFWRSPENLLTRAPPARLASVPLTN